MKIYLKMHLNPWYPRQNVMDPRHPRQNFNPRHPRHPHQNFMKHATYTNHAKIWPTHPRTHTTYATHEPTPPTRFSRLSLRQIGNFFIINNWQLVQKDLSHFPQSIFTEKVQKYLFPWSIFNLQLFHT